ncbi:hypothetical protein NPS01_00310 [Nocardioides psychrotolerans]|uniref:RsiG-like domain-containing protein n=1 Tax=Nocardioides psychrotolerans TaxID=1005945 RepID=A0A1I3BZ53_9ACTN|nr:hypothetical protein [Nocardioides psychrotolerans]GEP36368.1 hypothetical protein NPS01_00310 [Nocardioides psychrotolerans]SFH67577.1 hypothetical protein SAMN05216561_101412 [Nocardioides psychrotolerans]
MTLTPPETPLETLDLPGLRAYRQQLRDEEDRASYWRRLVHARLDLLEAGRSTEGSISVDDLVRVLGDTGSGASRTALLRVRAEDELPDLPDLVQVWQVPTTPEETDVVLAALRQAEAQLTGYRTALFAGIDAATAALVQHYRADPLLALDVLPG